MSRRFPVSVTTACEQSISRLWMGQLIFDGRHQRSVTLSRLRRLSKHGNNHTDQGRKRHHGVGGVRIFPLDTQLIPVIRHNGPVVGRLICREGPDEEDARLTAISKNEASAQPNSRPSLSSNSACARFAAKAPKRTMPKRAHPA